MADFPANPSEGQEWTNPDTGEIWRFAGRAGLWSRLDGGTGAWLMAPRASSDTITEWTNPDTGETWRYNGRAGLWSRFDNELSSWVMLSLDSAAAPAEWVHPDTGEVWRFAGYPGLWSHAEDGATSWIMVPQDGVRPPPPGRPPCCPPLIPVPPIPDCVVQFNYDRWQIRFPEFAPQLPDGSANPMGVSRELAQELFYDATMFLDNSCTSPVCDASIGGERERLLFLMTSHLAYLRGHGAGGMGDVGRATSKSVGPVSVGYTLEGVTGNSAWFAQTGYGLAFWTATAAYRVFRYRPGPSWRGGYWRADAWRTGYGNPLPFAQSIAR
ncbi:MAG: hypothetical protein C5B60_02635 [Chloroflexi bacterium]|nr:MAG: hypothetical protein C5B60_02635 [Chloroflexota bacterium]